MPIGLPQATAELQLFPTTGTSWSAHLPPCGTLPLEPGGIRAVQAEMARHSGRTEGLLAPRIVVRHHETSDGPRQGQQLGRGIRGRLAGARHGRGEYVTEIGRDIAEYASGSLPRDPSMIYAYRRFWRDNPEFVALTYARVASYWDAYYRRTLTLNEYPPHVAMVRVRTLVES